MRKIIAFFVFGLLAGATACTSTWVWVHGSDDNKVNVDSNVDSIVIDNSLFRGLNTGVNDTLLVKQVDTIKPPGDG